MAVFQKLRFARAFFAAVKSPERTQEILSAISSPGVFNPKSFGPIWEKVSACPEALSLIQQRYLGQWKVKELLLLPVDSFGYTYAKHMQDNGLDSIFYDFVKSDSEHAYLYNRGLQTHDIFHVLTGFDTSVPGEAGLQAFVSAQINSVSAGIIIPILVLHCALYCPESLPTAIASIADGWRMGSKARLLFGEKFEENWSKNFAEYRRELMLA